MKKLFSKKTDWWLVGSLAIGIICLLLIALGITNKVTTLGTAALGFALGRWHNDYIKKHF